MCFLSPRALLAPGRRSILHGCRRGAVLMIALEGTLAGLAHLVSGPDHPASVAPIAVDRPAAAPLTST